MKLFFLLPSREEVYRKCDTRFLQMLENGMLDEVAAIDKMQVPHLFPAMRAHGLRELISYLHGEMPLDEAINKGQQSTRNYVKRQFTWFRNQMQNASVIRNLDAGNVIKSWHN